MSTVRVAGISLDCSDPRVLAEFWASLLDGELAMCTPDVAVVRLPGLLLTALRVEPYVAPSWPEATVPKQLHLDLDLDDLEEAVQLACSLGAVPAAVQPWPESYRVLLDPAGHPFCLTTQVAAWR